VSRLGVTVTGVDHPGSGHAVGGVEVVVESGASVAGLAVVVGCVVEGAGAVVSGGGVVLEGVIVEGAPVVGAAVDGVTEVDVVEGWSPLDPPLVATMTMMMAAMTTSAATPMATHLPRPCFSGR
jgi:hypothetical protein